MLKTEKDLRTICGQVWVRHRVFSGDVHFCCAMVNARRQCVCVWGGREAEQGQTGDCLTCLTGLREGKGRAEPSPQGKGEREKRAWSYLLRSLPSALRQSLLSLAEWEMACNPGKYRGQMERVSTYHCCSVEMFT